MLMNRRLLYKGFTLWISLLNAYCCRILTPTRESAMVENQLSLYACSVQGAQSTMSAFWIRVLARYWQRLVGMNLISSEPQALRLSKALWGWISLVQNHKCCAQLCLYKLVMPEREVGVCFADEGQQTRNSCPELPIFFLLASHCLLLHALYKYRNEWVPSANAHAQNQLPCEWKRQKMSRHVYYTVIMCVNIC